MSDKKTVAARQKAINELLKNELISDQCQIVELLKSRYKIDTNQAVVSRDLHKLGVIKKQVQGSFVYELPQVDIMSEILRLAIVDIDCNEATIVIKTQPALADFVGDCLDQIEDLDILGCLSGENTVFVAPRSIKQIKKTCMDVRQKLGFKKKNG